MIGGKIAQQRGDAAGLLRPHAGERLVEQQELRPRRDQHGDLELALLAVAEMRGPRAGARGQAGGIERIGDGGAFLASITLRAQTQGTGVTRMRGDQAVLVRRERQDHIGALVAAAEAAPGDAMRRPAGDVLAVEADASRRRLQLARQQVDERGLAGAVRPDDAVHLVGREVERHAVDRDQPAEAPRQALDRQRLAALRRARARHARRAGRSVTGRRCLALEQPGNAARRRQHGADQDESERHRPVIGDRADQARGLQHLLQERIEDRAEDRAEQGADAAQHHHHDGEPGLAPAEQLGRNVAVDGGEVGVEAERARARLVVADRLQGAAERRAGKPEQKQIGSEQYREAKIIKHGAFIEIEQCEGPERELRLDVDVGAVRAAGDAGVVEQRIQHLPERERHHDKVERARQHRERTDHGGGCPREKDRGRKSDQGIGGARGRRHEIDRVGAEAEEHGVAEAHEPGDADEEIEAHHEHGEHHDAGHELDRIAAAEGRQHQREDDERGEQDDDAGARARQHVRRARRGRRAAPPAPPP